MEVVKMALVGCGNIARAHWRGISRLAPRIKVTAAVDSDPARAEAMAQRTGATAFTSLADVLARGDIDAVDLMLPHDQHEAAARAAFAAGKHVVLEKPMALNLASCERILAGAEKSGRVFMIAEQSQFWPDVVKAAALIAGGAIGDVIAARACFNDPLELAEGAPAPWRFDLSQSGGGITMDGGAHWLRPLRMMLGEIDSVVATTAHPVEAMQGESQCHAILKFASGVTGLFEAYLGAGALAPREDFRITGLKGEIVIEAGQEGCLRLFNDRHPTGTVLLEGYQGRLDSFGLEFRDFSEAVLDGKPLVAGPEYSLGELRAAWAIYRSAETGRWEKVW